MRILHFVPLLLRKSTGFEYGERRGNPVPYPSALSHSSDKGIVLIATVNEYAGALQHQLFFPKEHLHSVIELSFPVTKL